MSDFLWGLENSGWLKHIKAILDAGVFILRVRSHCFRTKYLYIPLLRFKVKPFGFICFF